MAVGALDQRSGTIPLITLQCTLLRGVYVAYTDACGAKCMALRSGTTGMVGTGGGFRLWEAFGNAAVRRYRHGLDSVQLR
jgi:hypothetical protein